MDKFVHTSHKSYGSRVKNSIAGFILGLIFFFGSFVLLWWNEGNHARVLKQISYLDKTAVVVQNGTVDRINDNQIISTSGVLTTDETLMDENISIKKALVLNRKVEMYQWDEDKHTEEHDNLGGSSTTTTTYTYSKKWLSYPVNSSKFQHPEDHINPEFPIKSLRQNASTGKFGAFSLTTKQTSAIRKLVLITNLPDNSKYKIFENKYYSSYDVNNPKVGDVRITYSYAPSSFQISLIGTQKSDNTIADAYTKYGDIYLQYDGLFSKDEVLQKYKNFNNNLTWVLRFLGWLVMFIGLNLIIKPIITIAKFIPPLASILGFFSGFILFIVSVILSLATITVAWFAYRPLEATCLIIVIVFLLYLLVKYLKKKKSEEVCELEVN